MMPRLLMLTHRAPFPPNRGDRIRSYHLLQELSRSWQVSLACVNDERTHDSHRTELQKYCQQVAIEDLGAARWLRAVKSAASGGSLTEGLFQSRKLAKTIETWANEEPFDCVLTYCSSMHQYASLPCLDQTPVVTDLVDVDSEKWRELSEKLRRSWRSWVLSLIHI